MATTNNNELVLCNLWDIVLVTGGGRNNMVAALTMVANGTTYFYIAPLEEVVKMSVVCPNDGAIEYHLPLAEIEKYKVERSTFDIITKK
jgi:hypothetical protein